MKKFKKLFAIMLVFAMVASLAACGGKDNNKPADGGNTATPTPGETAEATPTPAPRNLNGIEIIVGDWWSTGNPAENPTQRQEDEAAYREKLQADHNFTLVNQNLGSWGEYQEIFITSTMAGDPAAHIFIMDQAFVPEPIKQGLCYPVSDLPSFNFNDEKWNFSVRDMYSQNGKVYAFSEEMDSPGLGVFWNKRLFEEAGLDGDLLYDLQASGEWTWEKFKEIARATTRDINNNGVTDIYGVATWEREIVKAAAFSNGVDYVRFNPDTNRYENNQMHEDFLAAIQLGVDMYEEGLILPKPEGTEFTYFVDAFATSQAAMCSTEWYRHTSFQDMDDDWGFVFFPKGPGPNAAMQTMYVGNVRVMPAALNAQLADDIAFAYSLWVSTVPGYEEEDNLTDYYNVTRDARAVLETIKPMLEGQGVRSMVYMVPGLSFRHGANEDNGGLGNVSAIEIAESASQIYDAIINDFYSR